MRPRGGVIAGLLALTAPPAAGQPAPDAIDAHLRPHVAEAARRVEGPIYVEQTGRAPDGPPTAEDVAYDARLRESLAAAKRFEGPMAGGWTLAGPDGDLFALQLNDRDGAVEGAWRDLRRPAALDASGFLDQVDVGLSEVTLRFAGRVAVLRATDRGWQGELANGAQTLPVTLRPSGR